MTWLPDAVRFVTFLASAATVGLALLTTITYAKVYRQHRHLVAHGMVPKWRGLLPLHVALVGISYLTLVLASVYATAERLDGDLTWRGPVYMFSNTIGAFAMWSILASSRHRKHDLQVHVPGGR